MTREEAIRIIETVFQDEYVYKYYDSITHQALDMAIDALSVPQTDLISRSGLFNKLATVQAPPEANEYKAEVYKIIQSMEIDAIINVMEGGDEEPGQWQTENGKPSKAEYSVYCSKCGS